VHHVVEFKTIVSPAHRATLDLVVIFGVPQLDHGRKVTVLVVQKAVSAVPRGKLSRSNGVGV
jgi:hypothetical protein